MIRRAVLTCCDSPAAHEGVALVSLLTAAHGVVVDDLALGVGAAGPGAGVAALLVDAGQVAGALAVYPALGPAVGRGAHVARQTGARRDVVLASALGVRPARVRVTRVHGPGSGLSLCDCKYLNIRP